MRQNLLETYSRQLKVAEAYINKNFDRSVSRQTQLTTAVLLDNTNRFLTESLSTERANLGDWKKFCLNLTNLAVPSLIANDLVIVHPMTSYSGSVAYLKYVSLTNKGDVKEGDEFNSVFGLGEMTEARRNFTAQVIVETIAGGTGKPALEVAESGKFEGGKDAKIIKKTGEIEYKAAAEVAGLTDGDKVVYFSDEFQMERVPAKDIPTIGPKMEHIALVAEPRRIAVRYDQITAYQA